MCCHLLLCLPDKYFVAISQLFHASYIACPSHSLLFHHPNNISQKKASYGSSPAFPETLTAKFMGFMGRR
jgi:hypothetical protein